MRGGKVGKERGGKGEGKRWGRKGKGRGKGLRFEILTTGGKFTFN